MTGVPHWLADVKELRCPSGPNPRPRCRFPALLLFSDVDQAHSLSGMDDEEMGP
jgi:hypothetical protein